MREGPPGAPERAGNVPGIRHEVRWRARDAWRGFAFLLKREPWYGICGLSLTALWTPALAVFLTAPDTAPVSVLRQEAGWMLAAGLVLTAVAHRGTLLAQWRGRRR
jgi:hypothetical protein